MTLSKVYSRQHLAIIKCFVKSSFYNIISNSENFTILWTLKSNFFVDRYCIEKCMHILWFSSCSIHFFSLTYFEIWVSQVTGIESLILFPAFCSSNSPGNLELKKSSWSSGYLKMEKTDFCRNWNTFFKYWRVMINEMLQQNISSKTFKNSLFFFGVWKLTQKIFHYSFCFLVYGKIGQILKHYSRAPISIFWRVSSKEKKEKAW